MWRSTSKWHVMPFRQLYLLSLLLIFCCTYCSAVDSAFSKGDSTCLSSWRQIRSARVSLEEQCDSKLWQTGWRPDPQKTDFSYCTRKIITDLSPRFTPPNEFKEIQDFIRYSMSSCFKRTTGHNFIVNSFETGSEDGFKKFSCCSMDNCKVEVEAMSDHDYLKPYTSDVLVFKEGEFNFKYAKTWIDELKEPNWQRCSYNSMIFITNRIIDFGAIGDQDIYEYFQNPCTNLCIELTVILVSRTEATRELLSQYYSNITSNLFVVPDMNCLQKLAGCLLPCMTKSASSCLQEQLHDCPLPTFPPSTSIETTTSGATINYPSSVYVMYVFSLSAKLNLTQLGQIRDKLVNPIRKFSEQIDHPVVVGFYLPFTNNSNWFTDFEQVSELNFSQPDLLPVIHPIDTSINYTAYAIQKAITRYTALKNSTRNIANLRSPYTRQQNPPNPIIILLTDYVSELFVKAYYSGLKQELDSQNFTFRIYTYNEFPFDFFRENETIPPENLYKNDISDLREISLNGTEEFKTTTASPSPNPVKTGLTKGELVWIVIGSVVIFLLLLIVGTIIYRQKMNWMQKIERFRTKHQETEPKPMMNDYWELSWDRLMIKSEKLGSGAYGQVFRGKVHGKPPCIEHVYADRPHLAVGYENCDCAIKMLPKYATDNAKKEFMNEIELMKSIGFNENIVNLLGCITIGQAICLVLEYCPNRDLLQYVKTLKVDVNISQSMDIKINYTKEFMSFSWQVADGMRFLSSKHIIHRDLAARNILIDGQKNAKISDFGLCIMLDENYQPCKATKSFVSASGRLPIKWLAIEALTKHEFSTKSDVWSFGMMLWEMYSFGETPFNEIPPRKLSEHLYDGNRPEKPILCPEEMYDLMQRTWRDEPEKRPHFQEILTQLTLFLERATEEYGYIQLRSPEDYMKLGKLNIVKSLSGKEETPKTQLKRKKANRIFTSHSNASEHTHKHMHSSAGAKIQKRNSHSSHLYELEKPPDTT